MYTTNQKKILVFFLILVSLSQFQTVSIFAQETQAHKYWLAEQDSTYKSLHTRISTGDSVATEEIEYYKRYSDYLISTFNGLTDEEKAEYYLNRKKWTGITVSTQVSSSDDVYSDAGDRSIYIQHLLYSGYYGFYYGTGIAYLFDMKGTLSVGYPLVSAGISTLIPILTIDDKKVTSNSLFLAGHGKIAGALHAYCLSSFLAGGDPFERNINVRKLVVGTTMLSSIAAGRIGFRIGRETSWSSGRVAMYRYYGLLGPYLGFSAGYAINPNDPRFAQVGVLSMGALGYYAAHKISNRYEYTRGDVISTLTFTGLNTMLGMGILFDIQSEKESSVLIPASFALVGNVVGHSMTKGIRLTTQQGRICLYATAGSALIGLGLVTIMHPETVTPYYLVPYITGFTAYIMLMDQYKKKNLYSFYSRDKGSNWEFNFMPENYFINRTFSPSILNPVGTQLPLMALTLHL